MKRIFRSLALAGILLAAGLSAQKAQAASAGQCGDSVYYEITDAGVARITGTGDMWDYNPAAGRGPSPMQEDPAITRVEIGAGVTSVGMFTFTGCENLTQVSFPQGLRRIGLAAFSYTGLQAIDLPGTMQLLETSAFEGCRALTEVTIPASVTDLHSDAFYNCGGILHYEVAPGNPAYQSINGVIFDKSGQTILFYPQGRAGYYAIPGTVTAIGWHCFDNAALLTGVTIPDSVTEIMYGAFEGCDSLSKVRIPGSVTTIGSRAFYGCNLTELTVGRGVEEIGYAAFYGNHLLRKVILPESVRTLEMEVFKFCDELTAVFICRKTLTIGTEAFAECPDLTLYGLAGSTIQSYAAANGIPFEEGGMCGDEAYWMVDDGALTIAGSGPMWDFFSMASPFSNRADIVTAELEDGITGIGSAAFLNCSSLTAVRLPHTLTRIGLYAFDGCSALQRIDLPYSLESIEDNAFRQCTGLEQAIFPWKDVAFTDDEIFPGCTKLTIYGYLGTSAETLADEKGFPFFIMNPMDPADLWLPWELTVIEQEAFRHISAEVVYVNDNVKEIRSRAFAYCPGLRQVRIPEEISFIADNAFEGCAQDLIIYGRPGTYVQTYTQQHGFRFGVDAVG